MKGPRRASTRELEERLSDPAAAGLGGPQLAHGDGRAAQPMPARAEPVAVRVQTGRSGYDVHVGSGLCARADELIPELPDARSALVVFPTSVERHVRTVTSALARRGWRVHLARVPAGEAAKQLSVVDGLYGKLAAVGLRRADPVLAIGGGATTDVAGFAAATWLRGVPLVNVPTTVLGMADAAIGGKTGVDLPAGKNLVGVIHQPRAVLADLDTLSTLPARDLRAGLAEVLKAGFVGEPSLVGRIARDGSRAANGELDALAPLLVAAAAVKARVVAADELESDLRTVLNYGHTLAHALELVHGYGGIRHGEAVGLGMLYAAHVSEATGLAEPGLAGLHIELLRTLGLPVTWSRAEPDAVLAATALDKKHRGRPRMVLLRAPGAPEVLPTPARTVLLEALGRLRRTGR